MAQSGIATGLGLRGKSPNSLKVPDAPFVDITEQQALAISDNLKNLPDLSKLGGDTNEAILAALEKAMPGYGAMLAKGTENIMAGLSGQLPPGVERYIQQQAAQRGVARGTSGSEFDRMGLVRDLGLTSLQVADRALDSASRWMQTAQNRTFDFTQMFVSPAQRIATKQWNEVNRFNTQMLKNQIKMLPSNTDMMYAQILDYVATWATTAASMGTSSMMGGGGGQQQQPQQQSMMQQPYSTGEMNNVYNSYGPGY